MSAPEAHQSRICVRSSGACTRLTNTASPDRLPLINRNAESPEASHPRFTTSRYRTSPPIAAPDFSNAETHLRSQTIEPAACSARCELRPSIFRSGASPAIFRQVLRCLHVHLSPAPSCAFRDTVTICRRCSDTSAEKKKDVFGKWVLCYTSVR